MIFIDKRIIKAVAFCKAQESTRYAINGVLIESKPLGSKYQNAARAVATNGRMLAIADAAQTSTSVALPQLIESPNDHFLVPGWVIDEIVAKFDDILREIVVAPSYIAVRTTQEKESWLVRHFQPLEGLFPKYSEVIPKRCEKPCASYAVNPAFLRDIMASWTVLAGYAPNVRLNIPDAQNRPSTFTGEFEGLTFVVALMPVNTPDPWEDPVDVFVKARPEIKTETPKPTPKKKKRGKAA